MSKSKRIAGKNYFLHQKGEGYRIASKRLGHKLSLATSEEEDARLWEEYSRLLDRWQYFEVHSGFHDAQDRRFHKTYKKPVFDETYLRLTRELIALCEEEKAKKNTAERKEITRAIKAKKLERARTAHFVERRRPVDIAVCDPQARPEVF